MSSSGFGRAARAALMLPFCARRKPHAGKRPSKIFRPEIRFPFPPAPRGAFPAKASWLPRFWNAWFGGGLAVPASSRNVRPASFPSKNQSKNPFREAVARVNEIAALSDFHQVPLPKIPRSAPAKSQSGKPLIVKLPYTFPQFFGAAVCNRRDFSIDWLKCAVFAAFPGVVCVVQGLQ